MEHATEILKVYTIDINTPTAPCVTKYKTIPEPPPVPPLPPLIRTTTQYYYYYSITIEIRV